jgi:hypothetical protein
MCLSEYNVRNIYVKTYSLKCVRSNRYEDDED